MTEGERQQIHQVHILRCMIRTSITSGTAVYNQHKRWRASYGGRAIYVHRNTANIPGAALLLLLMCHVVGVVCRFLTLPIRIGITGAPPWAFSAPDLAVGTWAWVQTTRWNRCSHAERPALAEARAKASG